MKRTAYKRYNRMTLDGTQPIVGKAVAIPGYELFSFVAYNLKDYPVFMAKKEIGWVILELLTGVAVTNIDDPPRTLKAAVSAVQENMAKAKVPVYYHFMRSAFNQGLANPEYCGCRGNQS